MSRNVPTELLRSFVAVVDHGSMSRASLHVCLTQSAISLQMKRLEEIVRKSLFIRNGRTMTLTTAGEHLLGTARQILQLNDRLVATLGDENASAPLHVGVVQDFAETVLPVALGQFSRANAHVPLHVRVGGSPELLRGLASGDLDLVMAVGPAGDPAAVYTTKMLWLGKPHLAGEGIIPLVLLHLPCIFRDACIHALEKAGLRYRIVLETPHLSGLRAAVQAGLGLTCRTDLMVDQDTVEALPAGVMPSLPEVAYTLQSAQDSRPTVAHLKRCLWEAGCQLGWQQVAVAA